MLNVSGKPRYIGSKELVAMATATVSPIQIPATPADAVVYVLNVAGMTYPGPFMEGMAKLADVTDDITWDFGAVQSLDPTDGFAVIATKLTNEGFEAL